MNTDDLYRQTIKDSFQVKIDLLTRLTGELLEYRHEIKKSCDKAQEGNNISKEANELIESAKTKFYVLDTSINKFNLFNDDWKNLFKENIELHMNKMEAY